MAKPLRIDLAWLDMGRNLCGVGQEKEARPRYQQWKDRHPKRKTVTLAEMEAGIRWGVGRRSTEDTMHWFMMRLISNRPRLCLAHLKEVADYRRRYGDYIIETEAGDRVVELFSQRGKEKS